MNKEIYTNNIKNVKVFINSILNINSNVTVRLDRKLINKELKECKDNIFDLTHIIFEDNDDYGNERNLTLYQGGQQYSIIYEKKLKTKNSKLLINFNPVLKLLHIHVL